MEDHVSALQEEVQALREQVKELLGLEEEVKYLRATTKRMSQAMRDRQRLEVERKLLTERAEKLEQEMQSLQRKNDMGYHVRPSKFYAINYCADRPATKHLNVTKVCARGATQRAPGGPIYALANSPEEAILSVKIAKKRDENWDIFNATAREVVDIPNDCSYFMPSGVFVPAEIKNKIVLVTRKLSVGYENLQNFNYVSLSGSDRSDAADLLDAFPGWYFLDDTEGHGPFESFEEARDFGIVQ